MWDMFFKSKTAVALAKAEEEIRLLKIKIADAVAIDYQALMEFQGKLVAFTDTEPAFRSLYDRVTPYTMTSIERLYAMHKATEYIVKAEIPGAFVECGVWRGGSMMMAALTLLALDAPKRQLMLFDTFAGHPEPNAERDGKLFHDEWQKRLRSDGSTEWGSASFDEVRTNLESTGYPMDNAALIKGKVQDTIEHNLPESIALLRLDTDWYDSTAHELKHLYPRLNKGGILLIDDYGCMAGQRTAVDEYLAENNITVLLNRIDFAGRIAIKP
jgi:O-methyltransferase